ncbi:MAG TPA: ABC transporter permease [Thermoanaerobaculia bacterium]|jgi:lipopolysaccharide transport system permease protein
MAEEPLIVIQHSSAWRGIDFREVWRYREMLYFLVWRDVKVRYKQTTLGITWALIQPLLGMIVLAFVFGRVAKLPSEGIPYPLFAFAGLLPWTFFSNAVTNGSMSVINSGNLLTKVYFPRILIPAATVMTALVDFFIAAVMLLPLFLYYRFVPDVRLIYGLPLAMVVCLAFASGLSIALSGLVVRYRDLRHAIPFVMQIWMFATPIVYSLSVVPTKYRWMVNLNPMAPVIEAFRRSIFGGAIATSGLVWAAVVAVVLIFAGSVYFRRLERVFADVI